MKRLFGIIALATLLICTANAQTTNTNSVVTFPEPVNTFFSFLTTASNLVVVPYGTYDTGAKVGGGGIALAYKVTPLFLPVVRMDYLDSSFWMVSGGVELQVPIKVGGVVLVPFGLVAAATPFSGGGDDNGTLQSVTGLGMAVKVSKNIYAMGDYEWWSAREGNQIRGGIGIQF